MKDEGRAALALVKELVLRLKDEGVLDGRDIFDIHGLAATNLEANGYPKAAEIARDLWADVVKEG